tara:strand:+ start:13195 stop:13377 length:183 start_codon:yes stop_codon:yes gene_type:complete
MLEQFFACPFCLTEVSILVDCSIREQQYIEDCERCCRPIEFSIKCEEREIIRFDYVPLEQ